MSRSSQNPWVELPPSSPYVLGGDVAIVQRHNRSARARHQFQLDLMPEPFLGRPDAPVLALLGNPGYSPADHEWHDRRDFREAMRENLEHRRTTYANPLLAPEFAQASGSLWWTARLRRLIEQTSRRTVADNLLVMEALPYHSEDFRGVAGIPSQAYTQGLLHDAIDRSAVIVMVRGPWLKEEPGLASYPRFLRTNSWQAAHLSPGNLGDEGFGLVLDALMG